MATKPFPHANPDSPEALGTDAPKKGATRKTAHRRGRVARKEVDTSPTSEETIDTDFRCAVMSDGCFFISKDGESMELTVEEHRRMLAYLDRMREPEAT